MARTQFHQAAERGAQYLVVEPVELAEPREHHPLPVPPAETTKMVEAAEAVAVATSVALVEVLWADVAAFPAVALVHKAETGTVLVSRTAAVGAVKSFLNSCSDNGPNSRNRVRLFLFS